MSKTTNAAEPSAASLGSVSVETAKANRQRIARHRKRTPKWVGDAVTFWRDRVYEGDIGCDWDEADVRCWRCGYLRMCQKCHIIPRSIGGSDDVSNLIPLCAECHDEMPNVGDASEVWRWIAADHGECHDTYWTLRAARQAGLTNEQIASIDVGRLESLFMQRCSHHFGQLHGRARLNTATLAWVMRTAAQQPTDAG